MQAAAAALLAAQEDSSDDVPLAGVLHSQAAGDGMGGQQAAAEASPTKQVLVSTVRNQLMLLQCAWALHWQLLLGFCGCAFMLLHAGGVITHHVSMTHETTRFHHSAYDLLPISYWL